MPSKKVAEIHVKGVSYDFNDVSNSQLELWQREALGKFPVDKKYQVLYVDPPWSYAAGNYKRDKSKLDGLAAYPVMSLLELQALPIKSIMDKTSVMFLWVTGPMLNTAFELFRAWGLKYATCFMVWKKRTAAGRPVMGCGYWTRPSTEFVLCAYKGSGWTNWRTTRGMQQEVATPRLKHSEKPALIRQAIESFLDVPKRIELFARDTVDNWDAWGLEVSRDGQDFFWSSDSKESAEAQKIMDDEASDPGLGFAAEPPVSGGRRKESRSRSPETVISQVKTPPDFGVGGNKKYRLVCRHGKSGPSFEILSKNE